MRSLLESAAGQYGFRTGVSEAAIRKYSAEYGAQQIAMETLADQQAVFEATVYAFETADFYNIMNDGQPVTEGIVDTIKGGLAKAKKAVSDLWEKVKGWLHNIKRWIDGIFMDAQKFVNQYKSDLEGLKLSGFKYPLYTYDISYGLDQTKGIADQMIAEVKGNKTIDFSKKASELHSNYSDQGNDHITGGTSNIDESGLEFGDDEKKAFCHKVESGCDDISDVKDHVWSKLRSGANKGDTKIEVSITSVKTYMEAITKESDITSKIDKLQSDEDTMFKNVLNKLSTIEKDLKNLASKAVEADSSLSGKATGNTEGAKVANFHYRQVSYAQTLINAIIEETRSALSERTKDYKAMLMKALKYKEPAK